LDVLAPEAMTNPDFRPPIIADIESILKEKLKFFFSHRTSLDKPEIDLVFRYRDRLQMSREVLALILFSSIKHNCNIPYWTKKNVGNEVVEKLFVNWLNDESNKEIRIWLALTLGMISSDESFQMFAFNVLLNNGTAATINSIKKFYEDFKKVEL
jgi:hypothetical protein